MPQSLRDFVTNELDRVPATARALLEAASVAGLEFTAPELAHALGDSAANVEAGCESLARIGRLLHRRGEREAGTATVARSYSFAHAAYRRIVYEQIGPLRRQALHREIALGLEEIHGERHDALAARLAAHFERGGVSSRAAVYFDQAAANAEHRFAYRESVAHLRAALAHLERAGGRETAHTAGLYIRLGGHLSLVAGYSAPDAEAAFVRARTIFEAAGAWPGVFMAEAGLCRYELARGRLHAARAHADRLVDLARSELPTLTSIACLWAGLATSSLGELEAARAFLAEGSASPEVPGVIRHQDIHRMIGSQLGLVFTVRGELDLARTHAEQALARSRMGGRPSDLAHACVMAAERLLWLRERRAGHALAAEGITLATQAGFRSFLAFSRFYEALLDDERPSAERVATMRDALAERRRLGDRWHESMLFGLLAEAQLAAGDRRGALASLADADAHVANSDERHFEAELHRLRGECLLAGGERGAAVACFRRAVAVAAAQGARFWRLRAVTSLARADRSPEATALLADVLDDFPAETDCADLADARALREQIGGGTPPCPPDCT